jgi:hypothetical protein
LRFIAENLSITQEVTQASVFGKIKSVQMGLKKLATGQG